MKAILRDSYTSLSKSKPFNEDGSKNFTTKFRYGVTGTVEELEQYKAVQGINYKEDVLDQTPLYFTTNYLGEQVNLGFNFDGNKVIADRVQVNKLKALANEHGNTPLGQAIANLGAQHLVAGIFGATSTMNTSVKKDEGKKEEGKPEGKEADLSDLGG